MKINIQEKLTEKGMNKNQFAKMVQIGYPAACAIYNGETTRVSFDTLEKICIVLECTPNEILSTDDPFLKRIMNYQNECNKKSDTN